MAKIPFSIEHRDKIESGEYRVETKAGCPVRIVCWDMACKLPILGLVLLNDEKAEEIAVGFTNEGTNLLGDPLYDKLFIVTPEEELSEFEEMLYELLEDPYRPAYANEFNEWVHEYSAKLLALAREQFIKEGYVIEKKAFHDAVEKIDDKHQAEMSVQYSLHCKIQNGTRRAIMNWDTFQKVAQEFIDIGKAEALNELPRWKKIGRGNNYSAETKFTINGRYLEMNDTLNDVYEAPLSALEKLPKED